VLTLENAVLSFEEILSLANGNFEEQNKVLEPFIIMINYLCICIINALYNYYICNKGLLEECDKGKVHPRTGHEGSGGSGGIALLFL